MADESQRPPIEVHSIMLSEGGVEISYAEEDDASPTGVMMVRTIMIPRALVQNEVAELLDAAAAVIDAGHVAKRSPSPTFRRVR